MAIELQLAVMMARQRLTGRELARDIGITEANLSKLRTGRVKAIRLQTLNALCRALRCQPGDLLRYQEDVDEL